MTLKDYTKAGLYNLVKTFAARGIPTANITQGNVTDLDVERTTTHTRMGLTTVRGDGMRPTDHVINPRLNTFLSTAEMSLLTDVFVSGPYAYLTEFTNDHLIVVDISDPTNPTQLTAVTDGLNLNGCSAVWVKGNRAYVANSFGDGITSLDVSDPSSPSVLDNNGTPENANSIWVDGDIAYMVSGNGMDMVDISNPSNLTVIHQDGSNTYQDAQDMWMYGDYMMVANGNDNTLLTVDVSDPTLSEVVATKVMSPDISSLDGVSARGGYAFVSGQLSDNVKVLDMTDPTDPSEVGEVTGINGPKRIFPRGDYLYCPLFNGDGVAVVDVTDPTDPTEIGTFADGTNANGIDTCIPYGDYLYCSGDNNFVVMG